MNYTSNEDMSSPWIEEGVNAYGYRVNISHKDIYPLYQRFRKKHNMPCWYAMGDDERLEFELAVIPHLEKKFKCKAPPPDIPQCIRERLSLELLRRIYPQEEIEIAESIKK